MADLLRGLAEKAQASLSAVSHQWTALPLYEKLRLEGLNNNNGRTASRSTIFRKYGFFVGSLVVAFYFLLMLASYTGTTVSISRWVPSIARGTNRESLLASINYNSSLIESIKNGSLYHLDAETAHQSWRRPYAFSDPFSMTQVPLDNGRCKIYTYFDYNTTELKAKQTDPKKLEKDLEELRTEKRIVDTWARAWWALGFEPVVLNLVDARSHPRYQEFEESNVFNADLKKANAKWLAWLAAGAGIYSDYRVIPVTRDASHEAIQLLKSCSYSERMAFDDESLSLIVSDIKDTKPFLFDIMRGFTEKQLTVNFEVYQQNAFAYYSNRNFRVVSNTLKTGAYAERKGLNDAPVPASDVLAMMHGHLRQIFLDSYQVIGFAGPTYDPMSKILSHFIAECPSSHLANYCPPTTSALHNLAGGKDGSRRKSFKQACKPRKCTTLSTQRGLDVQSVYGITDPSRRIFTVAAMSHPWTHIAMQRLNTEGVNVTFDEVRESHRDSVTHLLTDTLVGSGVIGNDIRLLALKDSMSQISPVSNATWTLFENDVQSQIDAISRDVGFDIEFDRKVLSDVSRIVSYGGLTTYLRHKIEFIDNFLNSTSRVIARDLANNDYIEKPIDLPYPEEQVVDSLKAWSAADYEAWRFLHKFNQRKDLTWKRLKAQLESIDKALAQ